MHFKLIALQFYGYLLNSFKLKKYQLQKYPSFLANETILRVTGRNKKLYLLHLGQLLLIAQNGNLKKCDELNSVE